MASLSPAARPFVTARVAARNYIQAVENPLLKDWDNTQAYGKYI
jgi:hypothetical protein